MDPSKVLSTEFRRWLANAPDKPKLHHPTDPYPTSLRNTKRAIPMLQAVRAGKGLSLPSERSRDQAVSDLKALGTLVRGTRHGGDLALTQVGRQALETWEAWEVLTDTEAHEVARCILLIRAVMLSGTVPVQTKYSEMYHYWLHLCKLQKPSYWWQDLFHMSLPGYLDASDSGGYNPWEELVEKTDGDLGTKEQWDAWATSESKKGNSDLQNFLHKSSGNHRTGGSRNFRQAMQLIYIGSCAPYNLGSTIEELEITL